MSVDREQYPLNLTQAKSRLLCSQPSAESKIQPKRLFRVFKKWVKRCLPPKKNPSHLWWPYSSRFPAPRPVKINEICAKGLHVLKYRLVRLLFFATILRCMLRFDEQAQIWLWFGMLLLLLRGRPTKGLSCRGDSTISGSCEILRTGFFFCSPFA